jgi:hypothetical protein
MAASKRELRAIHRPGLSFIFCSFEQGKPDGLGVMLQGIWMVADEGRTLPDDQAAEEPQPMCRVPVGLSKIIDA